MSKQSDVQRGVKTIAKAQGHTLEGWKNLGGSRPAKTVKCTKCRRGIAVFEDGKTRNSGSGGSLQDRCPG